MTRLNLLLLLAAIACAVGVITAQHQSRKLFVALEGEQAAAAKLEQEWTQLQLEQSTWAANRRVEGVAARQLGMAPPRPAETVIVTLGGGR